MKLIELLFCFINGNIPLILKNRVPVSFMKQKGNKNG